MKVKVLVTQSCQSLCNPTACSLPGSSVYRILQARILEWVAIPFSRRSSDPGIECRYPALKGDSLQSEPPRKPLNSCESTYFPPKFYLFTSKIKSLYKGQSLLVDVWEPCCCFYPLDFLTWDWQIYVKFAPKLVKEISETDLDRMW